MDSLDLLRSRRRAATAKDQLSGFIVDGVVAHASGLLGEPAVVELRRSAKLPTRIIPFLKYEMPAFLDFADGLVQALIGRGHGVQEALEGIGIAGTEAFLVNPLGQMMLSLNGGNVQRMLARAPTIYSTVYTFGERRYERISDRKAIIHHAGDLMGPAIQTGVMKIAIRKSCDAVVTVDARNVQSEGRNYSLEISW